MAAKKKAGARTAAAARKAFSARDLGAELLPIITKGIYSDPLDALREYVQNAIDAGARHIEIAVSADLISVRDDGAGMSPTQARAAIRLGMSDKNPSQDVGFRGIGIYSAFDTCERLEVYTRRRRSKATKLTFGFRRIRDDLAKEHERRMSGMPPELFLEGLLARSVWAEDCEECPVASHGTLVLMVGIRGDVYKRLTDQAKVKEYLQAVVPLSFHPKFAFKRPIEKMFRAKDYRVVELTLSFNGTSEQLYRPYHNEMFTHGRGRGPEIFELSNPLRRGRLGFAWVCLNDARKVLPGKVLRGLLVKKFGFSVGGREHFAQYFSRAVFNKRVTGEIIIRHEALIPNAARTEFEPSPQRDALYMAFTKLAGGISNWANGIQEELKAREELEEVSPAVFGILKGIPEAERDVARLLQLNNMLASYENRLRTHAKQLRKLDPRLHSHTVAALARAKKAIAEVLSSKRTRASGRARRIQQAERAQAEAPAAEELVHAADRPQGLLQLLAYLDVEVPDAVVAVLEIIDREVLRQRLSATEYAELLEEVSSHLEEAP